MPQISLPDFKLRDIGDRLQDARDDSNLDELKERLSDAGERVQEAGARIGDEVGERVSDLRWSDLRLPGLNLPAALRGLSMPDVRAPKMEVPHMELPKNLPRNLRRELAKLEVPQVTIGKPKSGPPVVPFVLLAATAGLFVGWWLATSEFASTRIRSMVDRARARMGLAADWDEATEERTEEFWGSERGWETAGDADKAAAASGEWSSTTESSAPSASISGDDGSPGDSDETLTAADDHLAGAGATAGATSGWPGNPYGNPGGPVGGTWSEGTGDSSGGTGHDPDGNR